MENQRQQDCIWLLLGPRSGDNAQIRAVAAHLEMNCVEKHLTYNGLHMLPNLFKGASLRSLRSPAQEKIRPPWPRMVIAVGKRSVAIARYIKEKSGGTTRLVHLGRPRADHGFFDLVLTTPQYGLLSGANVLELPVPPSDLSRPGGDDTDDISQQFIANKPRPYIVMVAGGNSTTAKFTTGAAQNLAQLAQQRTEDLGGSLFALASPRTPKSVVETLQREFKPAVTFIPWKQIDKGETSPYAALLSLGDEIIVTSDSASMIADALSLNKPVKIFQLPIGWQGHLSASVCRGVMKLDRLMAGGGALILLLAPWRGLRRRGMINPPRQMGLLIKPLFDNGLAQPFPPSARGVAQIPKNPVNPVFPDCVIARIKSLLEEKR